MTNDTIKSVHVVVKEWRDKVNGNTYFSARAISGENTLAVVPYQSGYGSAGEYALTEKLARLGIVELADSSLYGQLKGKNIDYYFTRLTGCKKAEVKAFGESEVSNG